MLETSKPSFPENTTTPEKKSVENKSVEKEMGFSSIEFFRQFDFFAKSIPVLLQYDISLTLSESQIVIQSNDSVNLKITIDLTQLSNRSIGSLVIPRLLVQFSFYHCTELQQKEFIKKFDTSFQRGGG